MHEVPFCSLVPWFWLRYKGDFVKQMFFKEQNEQEVQSELVGYRWSITQTKKASLGKGWMQEGAESTFYFDEKRSSKDSLKVAGNVPAKNTDEDKTTEIPKHAVKLIPSFSLSCDIGELFTKWLTGSGGGCKKDRAAQQIVTRCFKFLRFCCEDEEELTFGMIDFSLCSPSLLFKFIDCLQDECKLEHGGRLGYIDAISELINFRKLHGASEAVL